MGSVTQKKASTPPHWRPWTFSRPGSRQAPVHLQLNRQQSCKKPTTLQDPRRLAPRQTLAKMPTGKSQRAPSPRSSKPRAQTVLIRIRLLRASIQCRRVNLRRMRWTRLYMRQARSKLQRSPAGEASLRIGRLCSPGWAVVCMMILLISILTVLCSCAASEAYPLSSEALHKTQPPPPYPGSTTPFSTPVIDRQTVDVQHQVRSPAPHSRFFRHYLLQFLHSLSPWVACCSVAHHSLPRRAMAWQHGGTEANLLDRPSPTGRGGTSSPRRGVREAVRRRVDCFAPLTSLRTLCFGPPRFSSFVSPPLLHTESSNVRPRAVTHSSQESAHNSCHLLWLNSLVTQFCLWFAALYPIGWQPSASVTVATLSGRPPSLNLIFGDSCCSVNVLLEARGLFEKKSRGGLSGRLEECNAYGGKGRPIPAGWALLPAGLAWTRGSPRTCTCASHIRPYTHRCSFAHTHARPQATPFRWIRLMALGTVPPHTSFANSPLLSCLLTLGRLYSLLETGPDPRGPPRPTWSVRSCHQSKWPPLHLPPTLPAPRRSLLLPASALPSCLLPSSASACGSLLLLPVRSFLLLPSPALPSAPDTRRDPRGSLPVRSVCSCHWSSCLLLPPSPALVAVRPLPVPVWDPRGSPPAWSVCTCHGCCVSAFWCLLLAAVLCCPALRCVHLRLLRLFGRPPPVGTPRDSARVAPLSSRWTFGHLGHPLLVLPLCSLCLLCYAPHVYTAPHYCAYPRSASYHNAGKVIARLQLDTTMGLWAHQRPGPSWIGGVSRVIMRKMPVELNEETSSRSAGWSPCGGFVEQQFRIGEASNPGPYSEGGATSSADMLTGGVASVSSARSTVRERPSKGLADGDSVVLADKWSPAGIEGLALAFSNDGAHSSGQRRQDFDDANNWVFGEEEEIDPLPGECNWQDYAPDLAEPELEAGFTDIFGEQLATKPSATATWECCPAIVEGVVELPQISEDLPVDEQRQGFYTSEGWWVSAPSVGGTIESIKRREIQLGISGITAQGKTHAAARVHPLQFSKSMWKEYLRREKLSCDGAEVLPAPPPSLEQELLPAPVQAEVLSTTSAALQEPSRESHSTEGHQRPGRRRGKRKRGAAGAQQGVSIWSFNSSGAPQLRAAVSHCASQGRDSPVAILCQEHHSGPDRLIDLQAQLKRSRWRLAASSAVRTTAGGWSAGVGVCTPSHVAAGVDEGISVDQSPASAPGRIASMWMQQVAPRGVR